MRVAPRPNDLIESERLILKRRSLDQAAELFAAVDQNREHLRSWMPWEATTVEEDDTTAFLKDCIDAWDVGEIYDYTVYEKSSGKLVGSFGLHTIRPHKRTADIGFWVIKSREGLGYISECIAIGEDLARSLYLHRLIITCDRRNLRSAEVARRNGYLFEAVQIDENLERGKYRDTLRFYKLLNPVVENAVTENLPEGYSIVAMESEPFWDLLGEHPERIFDDHEMVFRPGTGLTPEQAAASKELSKDFRWNFYQHLALMYDDQLAGWSWGFQDNRDSFHMINSAILPEHRGRRLYARLLDEVVRRCLEKGFQRIVSRHSMTNNAILIPKMKKGFVITGTEIHDGFGALVHLTYHAIPIRKKVLDFRVGRMRPDAEIKKTLKI